MTTRQDNWALGAFCQSYCRAVTGHHSLEDSSVFPIWDGRIRGWSPSRPGFY